MQPYSAAHCFLKYSFIVDLNSGLEVMVDLCICRLVNLATGARSRPAWNTIRLHLSFLITCCFFDQTVTVIKVHSVTRINLNPLTINSTLVLMTSLSPSLLLAPPITSHCLLQNWTVHTSAVRFEHLFGYFGACQVIPQMLAYTDYRQEKKE